MGRAPSALLVYLYIYKKIGLEEGLALVREARPIVNPNMTALREAAALSEHYSI